MRIKGKEYRTIWFENDTVKIIVKNESIKKNLAYNLVIKYWE